jgi:hypothetical protein
MTRRQTIQHLGTADVARMHHEIGLSGQLDNARVDKAVGIGQY